MRFGREIQKIARFADTGAGDDPSRGAEAGDRVVQASLQSLPVLHIYGFEYYVGGEVALEV
jgi:hypothetical protein